MFVPPVREGERIIVGFDFPFEIIVSMSWGLINGRSAGITSVASAFIFMLYSVASIIAWFIPRGLSSSSRVVFFGRMLSISLSEVTTIRWLTFFEEDTAETTSESIATTKRFLRSSEISFARRDLDSVKPLKGIMTYTLKVFPLEGDSVDSVYSLFKLLVKRFSTSFFAGLFQPLSQVFQPIWGR